CRARFPDPCPGEPAVVVIGGAGAFRRHHAGADRGLWRARGAEYLALPRLEHAFEYLAALAGLGVGYPDAGYLEQFLRVVGREVVAKLERGVRDEAEAAPLEVRPQLHGLADRLERDDVAVPRDDAGVLVLDAGLATGQL